MLFNEAGSVQAPNKCMMPSVKALEKRRLGEGHILEEDARLACSRVSADQRDMCVFDVMSTNDKDIAGSY